MQILIAFVVMGLIGLVAVVLAAGAALIKFMPLLVVVLVVIGAVRFWERRGDNPVAPPPAPPRPPAISRPAPPAPLIPPRPTGWVMVPVWMDPSGRPHRHPVIDAEVISEDQHHG